MVSPLGSPLAATPRLAGRPWELAGRERPTRSRVPRHEHSASVGVELKAAKRRRFGGYGDMLKSRDSEVDPNGVTRDGDRQEIFDSSKIFGPTNRGCRRQKKKFGPGRK